MVDLINTCQYLRGRYKEAGVRLFPVVPSDRTRGNGYDLKQPKFYLNIRKHFFTLSVTEHRNRLPSDAVESSSLEIFKSCLDMVLSNWL